MTTLTPLWLAAMIVTIGAVLVPFIMACMGFPNRSVNIGYACAALVAGVAFLIAMAGAITWTIAPAVLLPFLIVVAWRLRIAMNSP